MSTQLPQILAGAAQQQNGMATIVAIASVQLVLLAVWSSVTCWCEPAMPAAPRCGWLDCGGSRL